MKIGKNSGEQDPLGRIGRSEEGVEIWNRNWKTLKNRLFTEQATIDRRSKLGEMFKRLVLRQDKPLEFKYFYTPAGTPFTDKPISEIEHEEDLPTPMQIEERVEKTPLFSIDQIFKPGATVLDVGCGGGKGDIEISQKFPQINLVGMDYEMGKAIPVPENLPSNLRLQQQDWRNTDYPDATFDAFISDQGIARYGNKDEAARELTRIAKPGAIFRGTQDKGLYGHRNFSDRLTELGWDVYIYRNPDGSPSDLIIAQYKGAPAKTEVA